MPNRTEPRLQEIHQHSCHICLAYGFNDKSLALHLRDSHRDYDHQLAKRANIDLSLPADRQPYF